MNIKKVIQFSNGMMMVFAEDGNQMPEFQGNRKEVILKLKKMETDNVEFGIGDFDNGIVRCNKEQLFNEGWN